MGSELRLLRRFPGLRRLPHLPFVEVPTPVEPFRVPGVPDGALYVKRDDRSCPLYGGNKARKLEFVLGEARRRGVRRLVTTGGLGTHHGLATAILGAKAGFATTLVLVHQPIDAHVREQLLCMAAHGAVIVYGRTVSGTALAVSRVLARSTLRGERPMLVPVGGSSPLGVVGFVSAAVEIAEQIGAGAAPEPGEIVVAAGSGGTVAGLVLGARLVGWRPRIVGVVVTDILVPTPRRLARLARAALRRLRAADPGVPEVAIGPANFELVTNQVGPGYGAATPAAREAVARAEHAGLQLETTYTGKCLAAALERLETGVARPPVLFWNTFNGVDLTATALAASPHRLPAAIRALLEPGEAA
jgi:D-cysteine desulfhydrase